MHRNTGRSVTANASGGASEAMCCAVAMVIVALAVGGPLWAVARSIVLHRSGQRVAVTLSSMLDALGVSAMTSVGIAIGATLMGWPIAILLASGGTQSGRLRGLWKAVVFLPLVLPQALVYSGWGVMRSPDTLLGDRIVSAAQSGARWLPILIDRGLAVTGLALWAAPIAGIVLAIWFSRSPASLMDLERLETGSRLRRTLTLARGHILGVAASVGAVTAVMMGSAVPLHVAQLPTHATVIWRALSESSIESRGDVWTMATPTMLLAMIVAVAAIAVAWRLAREPRSAGRGFGDLRVWPSMWPSCVLAVCVWLLATLGPLALLVLTVRDWAIVRRSWMLVRDAIAHSAGTAVVVGLVCVVIAIAVGVCLWSRRGALRWMALVLACVIVCAGVTPGVMIGAATSEAWLWAPSVRDSLMLVIMAHTARFGFLAVGAAVIMRAAEPEGLRSIDRLEGSGGIADWMRTVGMKRVGVLVGVGLASAALSLHEIEAAVMIQPPGVENLSRFMLDALHFARLDELTGAMLAVCGLAAMSGLIAMVLIIAGRWNHQSA